MKLIIDIPDSDYERIKDLVETDTKYTTATTVGTAYQVIANGIPVSNDGDLISRNALRKDIEHLHSVYVENKEWFYTDVLNHIDNAPTVETKTTYDVNRAYDRGYITAMNAYARPKGDLISRQDVIDALEEQLDYLQMLNKNENPTAEGKWYGVNWARNTIADLPYKQNERPQGHWIVESELKCLYYCSNCRSNGNRNQPFCGWCGADMRKGGAE